METRKFPASTQVLAKYWISGLPRSKIRLKTDAIPRSFGASNCWLPRLWTPRPASTNPAAG
jgi:hypothetical protein